MSDHTFTAKYVPHGLSESAIDNFEVITGVDVLQADTMTVTLPDGVSRSCVPIAAVALDTTASPPAYHALTLTTYDPTTGILVITNPATGAGGTTIPATSKVLIQTLDNT